MKEFDKKIQQKLQNASVAPPSDLWGKIEDSLQSEDDKVVVIPLLFSALKYSIAASIAFLMGAGIVLLLINQEQSTSNEFANEIRENINNTTANDELIISGAVASIPTSTLKQEAAKNNNSSFFSNDEEWKYMSFNDKNVTIDLEAKYGNKSPKFSNENDFETYALSLIEDEPAQTNKIVDVEENPVFARTSLIKPNMNYHGWWIGPQVGYSSIFSGQHAANVEVGVVAGYDFKKRTGIQSGISYHSTFIPGSVSDGDLPVVVDPQYLASLNIPLLFRYKLTRFSEKLSRPVSLNFVSGVDYSVGLNTAFHQVGIKAAVEYDIFVSGTNMMTIGLQGGSRRNIATGDVSIFNGKYNSFVGAYVSMRFLGLKKK